MQFVFLFVTLHSTFQTKQTSVLENVSSLFGIPHRKTMFTKLVLHALFALSESEQFMNGGSQCFRLLYDYIAYNRNFVFSFKFENDDNSIIFI